MEDCIFCLISSGKTQSLKIFEDEDVIAVLDIYPATPGHTLIFPKRHFQRLEEIPDNILGKIIVLAKHLSIIMKNSLNAQGVNLYLASGEAAGQRSPHIIFHLIPRYDKDGLKFEWERKQVDIKLLGDIFNKIINNMSKGFSSNVTTRMSGTPQNDTNNIKTSDGNSKNAKNNDNKVDVKKFFDNVKRWFIHIYES